MSSELIAIAIQNNIRQLESISHNVVNSSTVGYQAKYSFSQYVNSKIEVSNEIINLGTSPIKKSGGYLDVAIIGEGFFVLESDSGDQVLSRNGKFNVNADGILIHKSGAKVMGNQGFIAVPESNIISIENDGDIYADDKYVDTLLGAQVITGKLVDQGKGLYKAEALNLDSLSFKQRYLNGSNVNSSQEMVRLIELSRHTQSLQKAFLVLDSIKNSGINKLGDTK